MKGDKGVKSNTRVLIHGSQERACALMRLLPRELPVIWVDEEKSELEGSPPYETRLGCKMTRIEGSAGNFKIKLEYENGSEWIEAGAVVLFPYTRDRKGSVSPRGERVLALLTGLRPGAFSRALDEVMMMARENEVFVVADSIQVAYPGGEEKFAQARQQGIVFFRSSSYRIENEDDGRYRLFLPVHETGGLGRELVLTVDRVWQADPLDSRIEEWRIAFRLGERTASGLLATRREGIFLFPEPADVTLKEEQELLAALAARISGYFHRKIMIGEAYRIEAERCSLCLTCFRICPHAAIEIKRSSDYANMYGSACSINPLACNACGACYAACPAQAIVPIGSGGMMETRVAVLACENSGGPLLERLGMIDNCRLYSCAGAITLTDVMEALLSGAEKVLVMACRYEACRHGKGDVYCERRLRRLNRILSETGLDKQVEIMRVAPADYVIKG